MIAATWLRTVDEVYKNSPPGSWTLSATVAGREVRFKVDTGADVTVVPYKELEHIPWQPSTKVLRSAFKEQTKRGWSG